MKNLRGRVENRMNNSIGRIERAQRAIERRKKWLQQALKKTAVPGDIEVYEVGMEFEHDLRSLITDLEMELDQ